MNGHPTMAQQTDKQLDITTPTGRFPISRLGVSSSKKARSQFKSPYGRDTPKTVKMVKSPEEETASLKEDILKNVELQKNIDTEINALRKQGMREEELNDHITMLHEYNEIKDIGQMLLGQIAVKEGVTTKDLYERFGLDLDD